MQLENQDGAAVKIDPEQQSLLIMGMTLHASGKKLLGQVRRCTASFACHLATTMSWPHSNDWLIL